MGEPPANRGFEDGPARVGLPVGGTGPRTDCNDDAGISLALDDKQFYPPLGHSLRVEIHDDNDDARGVYQTDVPVHGEGFHGSLQVKSDTFRGRIVAQLSADEPDGTVYASTGLPFNPVPTGSVSPSGLHPNGKDRDCPLLAPLLRPGPPLD